MLAHAVIHLAKTHAQLTLAAVSAIVASTLLIFADTLVLGLAHKPTSLAAFVGVLTCRAVAALVVGLIPCLVSVQTQQGA